MATEQLYAAVALSAGTALTRAKLTLVAASEITGIPYTTLRRKIDGLAALTVPEVYAIAKAAAVDPVAIFTGRLAEEAAAA